ncbi:MAG TPA: hypothetical protein VFZ66_27360 [Herpetosiphonaceae bacterium]
MSATLACSSAPSAIVRSLLDDDRLVVLATEVIGHRDQAALGAVALLDRHGRVLLHTHIRPLGPTPLWSDLPPIEVVWPRLAALLTNRFVASYHVASDRSLLRHTARRLGVTLMYAEWRGVGELYCRAKRRSRPCSFATACREQQIPIHPTPHALADARATLQILRVLARPTPVIPSHEIFWRYLR